MTLFFRSYGEFGFALCCSAIDGAVDNSRTSIIEGHHDAFPVAGFNQQRFEFL